MALPKAWPKLSIERKVELLAEQVFFDLGPNEAASPQRTVIEAETSTPPKRAPRKRKSTTKE